MPIDRTEEGAFLSRSVEAAISRAPMPVHMSGISAKAR